MKRSIAVVIPLFNGRAFIGDALDSVFRQTVKPNEIIVVDDGSSDDGAAVARDTAARHGAAVHLLHKPNGGQSSARNAGIRAASSDLIALLDQDDVWREDHLEKLAKAFADGDRKLGWVYSDLDIIDHTGTRIREKWLRTVPGRHPKHTLRDFLSSDCFILPTTTLISRSALLEVGGFDEQLSGYEDDDLFVRLSEAGYRNVFVNESLSSWRFHPGSCSSSPRMQKSRLIYMRKLLAKDPSLGPVLARRFIPTTCMDALASARRDNKESKEISQTALALLKPYATGPLALAARTSSHVLSWPAAGRYGLHGLWWIWNRSRRAVQLSRYFLNWQNRSA
jgi:glycosyltransferase involved in cell wall biosynthesis